jgi:hypothetical protein
VLYDTWSRLGDPRPPGGGEEVREVEKAIAGCGDTMVRRGMSFSVPGPDAAGVRGPDGAGTRPLLQSAPEPSRPRRDLGPVERAEGTGGQAHATAEAGR